MADRREVAEGTTTLPTPDENPTGDHPIFSKVRSQRSFEYVSQQIRDGMAQGRLKPGERLPAERELAQIFGISRQGVREALRGLEMSGLVESKPGVNGGAFIKSGDPAVVTRAVSDLVSLGALSDKSLFEARILLTSAAIRLVCERATEDDLNRLEDDIRSFGALPDSRDWSPADRTIRVTHFYTILGEATHNEVLAMLMNTLTAVVQRRLSQTPPRPLKDIIEVRRRCLELIRLRDPEGASEVLAANLRLLLEQLEENTSVNGTS